MLQILNVQLVRQTFSIQKQRLQMMFHTSMCVNLQRVLTRSSAVAERPREASCHWIFR